MEKLQAWLDEIKDNLPENDYNLVEKCAKMLYINIPVGENIPWHPYRCITPSMAFFDGIWNWDSAFHAIGVMRWDKALAKEQILGFIQYQLPDGMYIDCKKINGWENRASSKPPVLAWAASEIYKSDNDVEFVEKVYASLVKNENFWRNTRFYNGLFHYDANTNIIPNEEYDVNVRYESGWDDSIRWDKPCVDYWPVDLNCYTVMMYRGLKIMADALNKPDDAVMWQAMEQMLCENINKYMWNDTVKAYVDVNRFTLEPSSVYTPASFMPLYIGIADNVRAEHMNNLAKAKFLPGMPTVAYDDPEYSQTYWRGNTWLNVAYFAAKALKNYGFSESADTVRDTILNWVRNDGEFVHENYDSTTGQGLYCSTFSWSCVFVIEFILNF